MIFVRLARKLPIPNTPDIEMSLISKRRKVCTAIIATAASVVALATGTCSAEEMTIDEFKSYVSEKTNGQLNDAMLDELAKAVDKDGDGTISEEEFENRMAAFQRLAMRGQSAEGESAGGGDADEDRGDAKSAKEDVGNAIKPVEISALTPTGDATILLITGDEIAEAWLPYAKWKTANGKATKVITVSQIDKDFDAKSIQEKIRLCVQKHIRDHQTRWVVLGGDCTGEGEGLVPGGHRTFHAQERRGIPTDIVYLSESSWDQDNDGKFGEFEEDRDAITYPDGSVGLGRIPVRTAEDVAAFTEKVIAYESNYPTSDFATQMIYTCTDRPAYPKVRNSWDGYLSKVWDGEMGRYFSAETPWDQEDKPGSFDLTADNLVELINKKKVGKFHIHGHGHLPAWVLEGSRFTGSHVEQLKNDGAYPLMTTVSCNTGEYDSKKDPSIVEQMIRKPQGGSVAIVAPIRTGKPHFASRSDMRLMVTEGKLDGTTMTMTRYWENGLGHGMTTGEALMKAKSQMASDAKDASGFHLCICELNLLGDPTLDMRADSPRNPQVTFDDQVSVGKQRFEVRTDSPGSTVCLWKGQEYYSVKKADEDGIAKFSLETKTPGELSVGVTGPNLNSRTAKVRVVK